MYPSNPPLIGAMYIFDPNRALTAPGVTLAIGVSNGGRKGTADVGVTGRAEAGAFVVAAAIVG